MPHSRRNTALGFCHRPKQDSTEATSPPSVSKKRLCVAILRASFQTRSMGANCGLYGGRKSSVSTLRYFRNKGLSNTAWWYLALSSTMTMRLPRERCRNSFFRNASNVRASNFSHTNELAAGKAHGAKAGHRLAGGRMHQYGILDLRRHPHPAPRAVLLEMAFVQAPQFNVPASCRAPQFF